MRTFLSDAMMKEAAAAITRCGVGVAAEFIEAKGVIILKLDEEPYTEIFLEPKK